VFYKSLFGGALPALRADAAYLIEMLLVISRVPKTMPTLSSRRPLQGHLNENKNDLFEAK
jgi:hypothetical protein